MTSSTLAAMAEAVEKASVVIMLVAAEYKQSEACRTEGWIVLFMLCYVMLCYVVCVWQIPINFSRRIRLQFAQENHSDQGSAWLSARRMAR